MTAVYCFSGTGHSRAVAGYFANQLYTYVQELGKSSPCSTAVVVFPVYCENVPDPVKRFLPQLEAESVVLIATYGKMWHGNALAEAQKLIRCPVIAGAYIPTGHTYLTEDTSFDTAALACILTRIANPQPVQIPDYPKHIWADFFPAWRSRMGVKIVRSRNCIHCGLCEQRCPMGAIRGGRIRNTCIRCLRCVRECPRGARSFLLSPIMKHYLSHPSENRIKIFL